MSAKQIYDCVCVCAYGRECVYVYVNDNRRFFAVLVAIMFILFSVLSSQFTVHTGSNRIIRLLLSLSTVGVQTHITDVVVEIP